MFNSTSRMPNTLLGFKQDAVAGKSSLGRCPETSQPHTPAASDHTRPFFHLQRRLGAEGCGTQKLLEHGTGKPEIILSM